MLLLLIAAAAQAAASPPLAAPAAEKKVCKLEEDVSSRIRIKKICLPQSEWDEIAKATQADLEGSRNDRTLPPPQ
jgi:hypothetical protein